MYLGVLLSVLFAHQLPALRRGFEFGSDVPAVLIAGTLIVIVGLIDDRWGLDALTKFAGQITAASVLVTMGVAWSVLYIPIGGVGTIVLDQASSILLTLALTVSFGLGLSATIHFLNRLRLESKPGVTPDIAVERATVLMGPALILTTVVLACGLVVTVFSDLPSLRLFGWLSAFSMVSALVADLFILRPTAMFLITLSQKLRGISHSAEPAEQSGNSSG